MNGPNMARGIEPRFCSQKTVTAVEIKHLPFAVLVPGAFMPNAKHVWVGEPNMLLNQNGNALPWCKW